jgi:bifunctional non-homologous end joining protein LigD
MGMEGVIAKRVNGRYQPGKRSTDWVKFRVTRRISCIASGYSPGNGSRAHFGALHLALIKDGEVVPVGRTGSGFTEKQTHDLKARLDAGEFFVVEIEAANRTSADQLRFPTFRGIRKDKAIHECTFDQLDELARC